MANNVTDLGKVGITLKGEWSSATNYERLDAVTYDGSLYIAIKDNANVNPGANPTYWLLSAKHGEFTDEQLEDFKAEVVAESKEEMDDYTDDKKAELDTYEGTKETELNTYTGTKKTELDTYTGGLKDDFDDNASTKTTAFNDNATSKTNAFNTNATNKTTDFNDNATAKTTEFNTNASEKTDDFDDNVTAKTTAFDEHVEEKTEEFDENVESLQQEIDELSENMPWETTEQATEIQVTDAAKYSRNKLELFGNTEQIQYTGKNLLDVSLLPITAYGITISKDDSGNVIINGTPNFESGYKGFTIGKYVTIPAGEYTISVANKKNGIGIITGAPAGILNITLSELNTSRTATVSESTSIHAVININYDAGTFDNYILNPMLELSSTATDYEPYVGGVPSPNPDYPQDIHVVTGNNTVEVQGKNLWGGKTFTTSQYGVNFTINIDGTITASGTATNNAVSGTITQYNNNQMYKTLSAGTYTVSKNSDKIQLQVYDTSSNLIKSLLTTQNSGSFTLENSTDIIVRIMVPSGTSVDETFTLQLEPGSTATDYVPYYHADYPINLGSLELCKIGDYQDYLYKENGNWYKYGAIDNVIITETTPRAWYKSSISSDVYSVFQAAGGDFSKYPPSTLNIFCNKFIAKINTGGATINGEGISTNSRSGASDTTAKPIRIAILKSRLSTDNVSGFKEWLSNNNLTTYISLDTPTSTQITDATLIAQLDAIYEHLQLVKGTNNITVTAEDLAPNMELSYMQDLKSKLDNIDSRLSLLE